MKYCPKCGEKTNPKDLFCPSCGSSISDNTANVYTPQQVVYYQSQSNGMAIAGFILSFIMPFLGLIFSIIGLSNSSKLNGEGRGLAIAGIVISAIEMVVGIIISIILLATYL